MHRVGLFDIFHARWFAVSLGLMIVSTAVYILSRLPAIWMAVTQPRKRVPERYFELAPHRYDFETAVAAADFAALLRRKRFKVDTFVEPEATYLFADRFAWAQFATVLTHAAIVVFVLAAVVSRADGFSEPLFIGEGATAPVFPVVAQPNQMQVKILDAIGVYGADGLPTDYRTELAIYQGGQEVKRCVTTVNSPCSYQGYRFHQAAYYGYGAELQVRDLRSGDIIYHETFSLDDQRPAPHFIIRDAASKQVLFDDSPVLGQGVTTETDQGPVVAALSQISLPDGRSYIVGMRNLASGGKGGWSLLLLDASSPAAASLQLAQGASGVLGSLEVEFLGVVGIPALLRDDVPLPAGAPGGGQVLLQLSNVYAGTGTASEGTAVQAPVRAGEPTLTMLGASNSAMVMRPGQSLTAGNYQYTFVGQREFAGLQVKKDSSDLLVWAAMGLLIAGLLASFWVPRRRLWAKITADRTYLVGQTNQMANLRREMRALAAESGASVSEDED
ncbi:MAG TPA: cytochrome c biogenesis protein ResB, partial [Dehalococcoidia bacterium]|nr:cytochrome c biogenesis protein ResB [Dehalococcoidia bacterium]